MKKNVKNVIGIIGMKKDMKMSEKEQVRSEKERMVLMSEG